MPSKVGHPAESLIIPAVDITKLQVVKPKSQRTREYLALIPIESALSRLEGGE